MTTSHALRLERTLDAPVQRVFDAWTDPALLAQWYAPDPSWEIKVENDLRVGGAYTVAMGEHVVSGTYTEIDQPRLIAFTWKWAAFDNPPSQVRVELTEVDGGTHLVLTHTDLVDADDVKNHEEGWNGCLVRLPAAL